MMARAGDERKTGWRECGGSCRAPAEDRCSPVARRTHRFGIRSGVHRDRVMPSSRQAR